MFNSCQKLISRKKSWLPFEKFASLYCPGMQYGYNTILSDLRSFICEVVAHGMLKTKKILKSGRGR